eukprot:148705_1
MAILSLIFLMLAHPIKSAYDDIDQSQSFHRRRLSTIEYCQTECLALKLLIVNGPGRVQYYKTGYAGTWEHELNLNVLQTITYINRMFQDSNWKINGETAIKNINTTVEYAPCIDIRGSSINHLHGPCCGYGKS